jgi:hypothetical protein
MNMNNSWRGSSIAEVAGEGGTVAVSEIDPRGTEEMGTGVDEVLVDCKA